MQKTICTRDRSLCLLPFDMCEITKVPQIPTECLSFLAKMTKTKERKKKKKSSPAATSLSLKKMLQMKKKEKQNKPQNELKLQMIP